MNQIGYKSAPVMCRYIREGPMLQDDASEQVDL